MWVLEMLREVSCRRHLPCSMQGGRVLEQGTHEELMMHRNGAYTQLVHHRQQQAEEAPAAADDDIVLAPESEEEAFAGKAAARRSMAVRSSMAAGRHSMAPGRKSMAPGRKSMAPGRKDASPGRQSIVPAGRKSVFPGRHPSQLYTVATRLPCGQACRPPTVLPFLPGKHWIS